MATELTSRGVCVQRRACGKDTILLCYDEAVANLARMLALPATMAERSLGRHFLSFSLTRSSKKNRREPKHRRDFAQLRISTGLEEVLKTLLSGPAGDILAQTIGVDAELCGLSVIVAEPSTDAQPLHADGTWSRDGPRIVTLFVALHDILDETQGATRFVPNTHEPACFPPPATVEETRRGTQELLPPGTSSRPAAGECQRGQQWVPPTEALVAARGGSTWFPLEAGDCVLFFSTTWHGGGANTSQGRRVLLSVSVLETISGGTRQEKNGGDQLYLGDFRETNRAGWQGG